MIVGLICTGSRVVYLFGLFEGLCLFIISFVYSKNKKYHIIIVKKNNETIEKNFEEPIPITKLRFCLCMYNDYDLDENNEIDYIIVE